jgi:quercetin dioxygenase-like cupin family protein
MSESIRDDKGKARMISPFTSVAGLAMLGATAFLAGMTANAQDAAKVDPKHYKVEFENAQVRVLRITYGPHEKSVMHSHPAGVIVYLTDASGKFTMPGGATKAAVAKAGSVTWVDRTVHLPENTGDKPFEVIEVELKTKPAATK